MISKVNHLTSAINAWLSGNFMRISVMSARENLSSFENKQNAFGRKTNGCSVFSSSDSRGALNEI